MSYQNEANKVNSIDAPKMSGAHPFDATYKPKEVDASFDGYHPVKHSEEFANTPSVFDNYFYNDKPLPEGCAEKFFQEV